MKLANRAFLLTIILLSLALVASAQTLRPADDDRNIAPTVGTGGPVGGPTGLFTVYDGQTLRRGEFTLSVAFSNYDRDPGDVDISEVPVSFQIGLSDHVELFFNVDAYRGIKVNSPSHLSSFYLPNATFGSGPAIVLAPSSFLGGQFAGSAVFRPSGNQPFVFFPYIGGSAGTYGVPIGPGHSPTIGSPVPGGAQSVFPGLGSIYGSILPGVVLQTALIDTTGQGGRMVEVPTSFTAIPSYLPDAPFIGRTYGESAFSTFTVGGKIRFTGPNNPIGVGVIPFYRWYYDRPSSSESFTQLQRGASPGSKRGDIGLIGFADARVRKWMNISANVGYIYNGDVKADFPEGGDVTLLDRPDELLAAFGVDFPVNRFFQPIAEFRSLHYVGGRTPNSFENSPLEGLVGARVFPARWFGFGLAYRHHFNPQDRDSFDDFDFNGTVVIPCFEVQIDNPEGTTGPTCTPQVISTSNTGVPPGFRPSTDPHGFIVQGWVGRRNERQEEILNVPAVINSVTLSENTITKPCEPGFQPKEGVQCRDDQTVDIRTNASDEEGDVLTYNYTVSGGRIVGQGANVTWDLSGVNTGTYTVTVAVDDGCGVCSETKTETVEVVECDCEKVCECPTLTVDGPPAAVEPGDTMTFTANVVGGNQQNITYSWEVSQGSIQSGQGTPQIVVDTTGLEDTNVRATVSITGDEGCNCDREASETGVISGTPDPRLVDEFGPIPNNDVKARLDIFITQLANDPTATGYIVNYGSARDVTRRERLIRDYMVNENGVDPSRLVFVNGGVESAIRTRLWIVPAGADASTVNE
ncbi:MAG: hypothetical protein DWQ47_02060 [Acidobacteria bacterium]|nr:MAG: hypothetical protein DWQ32_05610 [Acidobacteriota bacterium]REK01207.1 MAG: hypothetical protein DWQ38_02045 [Acidobacteriota bacterium]REK14163.1 MAG: hypothetical protein DWQ43_11300 [Acidobacteriota bacterium]REK44878.1 MAG: hypothetical protein DWQ47_02060 [Acidobacteriota bacterium]